MEMPLPIRVSIIMPCYNAARFIGEAIDSVLAQAEVSWELIIIDDGSTDGSADIVRRYSDPRITLLAQANAGVSAARNAGLASSRGEFVAFLDADDRMRPDRLQLPLEIFAGDPSLDMVVCDFVRFEQDSGDYLSRQFQLVSSWQSFPERRAGGSVIRVSHGCAVLMHPYLQPTFIWTQNVLLRGQRARAASFPVGVAICEDAWYLLRVMPGARMAIVEQVLVELRRHDANSFVDPAVVLHPLLAMFSALQQEGFSAAVTAKFREGEGRALVNLGYHHRKQGDRPRARSFYCAALSIPSARLAALLGLVALLLRR
jgi:cellulose synthase/poly-beta-1,6-N-acetylglucosamine synthase-like glycosyltransferase